MAVVGSKEGRSSRGNPGSGSVSFHGHRSPGQWLNPILSSPTPDTISAIGSIAQDDLSDFDVPLFAVSLEMAHRLSPSVHPTAPHRGFRIIRHAHHQLEWCTRSLRTALCAGTSEKIVGEGTFVIEQRGYRSQRPYCTGNTVPGNWDWRSPHHRVHVGAGKQVIRHPRVRAY